MITATLKPRCLRNTIGIVNHRESVSGHIMREYMRSNVTAITVLNVRETVLLEIVSWYARSCSDRFSLNRIKTGIHF